MRKNKNISESLQQGFSLMEMMVVLLIVAIIAAASAPMVTKKISRNAGTGDSPWVFTGLNNNIAYNLNGGNSSAIIGSAAYNKGDNGPQYPRLVIASGNDSDHSALVFADKDGKFNSQINMNATTNVVTMNDSKVVSDSIAFGFGHEMKNKRTNVIAIGNNLTPTNELGKTIAIGFDIKPNDKDNDKISGIAIGDSITNTQGIAIGSSTSTTDKAIAIGKNANATGKIVNSWFSSIAIGTDSVASAQGAIAIGSNFENAYNSTTGKKGTKTEATAESSIALGTNAKATGSSYLPKNSIAIGTNAEATENSSLAIGDNAKAKHTYSVAIGSDTETSSSHQIVLGSSSSSWKVYTSGSIEAEGTIEAKCGITGSSDRRLKNVGKKYTAGLEELKKLELFHYTFKDDKAKTPRVGVMAQDLQKVFPDAVTEGKDGYLRIRKEDMFYAVINAVKELNAKITSIVEDITGMKTTIAEQQKTIEELQKQNAEFEKRLKKLEKRYK